MLHYRDDGWLALANPLKKKKILYELGGSIMLYELCGSYMFIKKIWFSYICWQGLEDN